MSSSEERKGAGCVPAEHHRSGHTTGRPRLPGKGKFRTPHDQHDASLPFTRLHTVPGYDVSKSGNGSLPQTDSCQIAASPPAPHPIAVTCSGSIWTLTFRATIPKPRNVIFLFLPPPSVRTSRRTTPGCPSSVPAYIRWGSLRTSASQESCHS